MKYLQSFFSLLAIQATIATTSIISAQTWNTPTSTRQVVSSDNDQAIIDYINWQWVDPTGITHSFPGDCEVFITYINSRPFATADGLTNVQASDGSSYFLTTSCNVQGVVRGVVSQWDSVYPKFHVLSVTYTPPGPKSSVDYKASSMVGVSTSLENTFQYAANYSVGVNVIAGSINIGVDYTHSTSSIATEGTSKTASYDISTSNAVTATNNGNYINHDYDVIDIWLNPQADVKRTGYNVGIWDTVNRQPDTVNGWDTYIVVNAVPQMDHIPLLAGYLNGNIPWPTDDTLTRLSRSWDHSLNTPGLTIADYAAILAMDPWAQQIDPNTGARIPLATNSQIYSTTMLSNNNTNNRYTFISNVGYLPTNQDYTGSFINASTSSSTNSYKNIFSVDYGEKSSFGFTESAGVKWTWTNAVSNVNNSSKTNQATYSILTPNPAFPYPQGSSVNVYQDNLYGTFMFVFPGGGF